MASQLDHILKNENLLQQIQTSNRSSRFKSKNGVTSINDATDGQIYQNFIKNADPTKLIISLNLNSDGAPIDSVGKFTMWPVLGTFYIYYNRYN